MQLGRKLTYLKQQIESVLRHDDEPLAVRRAVAAEAQAHLARELEAAEGREAARVVAALADDTGDKGE